MAEKQETFILCADDFALTPGVSRAILALGEEGRLGATSVMTNRPHWASLAPALRTLAGRLSAGLHVNLTCGAPLTALPGLGEDGSLPRFGTLLARSLAGRLPVAAIAAEIGAQLDAFSAHYGAPPAFIDGHQHVHVLPGVRGALFGVLVDRGLAGRLWLRDPADSPPRVLQRGGAVPKALVISALAAGFGARARRLGFATNAGFAGVSAFADADFGAEFRRFLVARGARHLVMCHPGEAGDAELAGLDPVVASRPREYDFLRSPAFAALCDRAGVRVAPEWEK